jgi:hypothetical protein
MTSITPDLFIGWESYPLNLPVNERLGYDAEEYSKRLTEQSESLFSDEIEVRVIDINGSWTVQRPGTTLLRQHRHGRLGIEHTAIPKCSQA